MPVARSKQLIRKITRELQSIYSAREAEGIAFFLLEESTGIRRNDILLDKNVEFDKSEFDHILERLRSGEPVQYIAGSAHFYGRKFKVTRDVLIPRQETEELVDQIIKDQRSRSPVILDIGTGSGCVAITLKLEIPGAVVSSFDINPAALAVARKNSEILKAPIQIFKHDLFSQGNVSGSFDIIVSNPPYVTDSESKYMHRNVLKYEPKDALFVQDDDPLIFYRYILKASDRALKPGGSVYLEINENFGSSIKDLLSEHHFDHIRILKDLNNKDRIACAVKRYN